MRPSLSEINITLSSYSCCTRSPIPVALRNPHRESSKGMFKSDMALFEHENGFFRGSRRFDDLGLILDAKNHREILETSMLLSRSKQCRLF
jgi:hypothetical protein